MLCIDNPHRTLVEGDKNLRILLVFSSTVAVHTPHSPCSAVGLVLQSVSFSHDSSSSLQLQPDNSIFLSQHSNSNLQLQPAEHSDCILYAFTAIDEFTCTASYFLVHPVAYLFNALPSALANLDLCDLPCLGKASGFSSRSKTVARAFLSSRKKNYRPFLDLTVPISTSSFRCHVQ